MKITEDDILWLDNVQFVVENEEGYLFRIICTI